MSGKFALIIGNTEYIDPGLAQLSAPGKDTEDFARVLKDQEIGAFDKVTILLNELSSTVNESIDEFFDQKKSDDLLVLYFSGHGVRDELGALYLAVRNTIRTRLRSTAIKSDYIRDVMDQSRSKRQVLILDCCMSGAFSQGTKAATGVSIGTASAFESGFGRIILTASDSTQFAWEGDQVIGETDNSLFTHYLVEGLEGEADYDGDGRITVDELYDYAYEKVRFATPKQTPSKFSSKQQGEIILRQSTRLENIKPLPLSPELIDEIEDTRPYVREAAVQKLEKIIRGKNIGLARSAKEALERIALEDDSRRVSQLATQVLDSIRQIEQKAEEERRAREEAERLAMLKAEEERLARETAQAERRAKAEAERLAHAQAERAAAERKAAQLKVEREAAELAVRQAAEKVAREIAEKEAAEREADRLKIEQEATREKAERNAAEKAEREAMKLAARKKSEREAAEKAEREAMELAVRRKAERKATETANSQSTLRRQPILTWGIIGITGLCVVVAGAWGISYLANLGVTTPEPTELPVAATEAPAGEAVTLNLWVYDDGRLEVLKQLGQKFEEEYGVALSVEVAELTEIRNAMTLGAASGEGPDMVIIPHDNLGPMVENGSALEIDLGDKASNYLPNAIAGFNYNGKLYGLPLAVENIGFFRNTDMVPDVPTTWDNVAQIGTDLVNSGTAESAIGLPDLTYNIYPIFTSYGGYIFGRNASGSFTVDDMGLDNEGMVKGLTWVKGLVDAGVVSPTIDWEASHVLFETGKSPFIMTGPWALDRFQTAGVPYAISAFPAAEVGGEAGYPFLGVQGIVINSNGPNVVLAQTFLIEFLATEENYQAIFDAEHRPSAWKTIFDATSDADTTGFNAAGVNADPMPSIPAMGFVWEAWINAGNLTVSGELSAADALKAAEEQVLAQAK